MLKIIKSNLQLYVFLAARFVCTKSLDMETTVNEWCHQMWRQQTGLDRLFDRIYWLLKSGLTYKGFPV